MGKGTRFNAHKAHVDDYFTTKIYEFTTKCRACANCEFKIRTNPKEQTFDYVSGIRRKIEEFDSRDAGTLGVIDTDAGAGIYQYKGGKLEDAGDEDNVDVALKALEKSARGKRKAMTEYEQMESLYRVNTRMEEDADANAVLRSGYRKERKAKKRRFEEAKKLGLGRGISLAGETEQDVAHAKVTMGLRDHAREQQQADGSEKKTFHSIRTGSIFSSEKQKQPRSRSGISRGKHGKHAICDVSKVPNVPVRSREKKKIILIPRNAKNGTKMDTKVIEPTACAGAISALAGFGSDSD